MAWDERWWQEWPHPHPTWKAQLTLPLSTISFCRLVDVVTRSRMACQEQDLCHTWGSPLSYSPPLGSRPAAHLHEVCAGIEDPMVGGVGREGELL